MLAVTLTCIYPSDLVYGTCRRTYWYREEPSALTASTDEDLVKELFVLTVEWALMSVKLVTSDRVKTLSGRDRPGWVRGPSAVAGGREVGGTSTGAGSTLTSGCARDSFLRENIRLNRCPALGLGSPVERPGTVSLTSLF